MLSVRSSWAGNPSEAEKELVKLENAWSEAVAKKDTTFLHNLYADEFMAIDKDGAITNKAQEIANTFSGKLKFTSYRLEDLKVRLYSDVAVVTGNNTVKATFQDHDISGLYRFTDVFVKRSGRWQCVVTQGTLVAKN
jgi:ketosteroid isomerase-like protein